MPARVRLERHRLAGELKNEWRRRVADAGFEHTRRLQVAKELDENRLMRLPSDQAVAARSEHALVSAQDPPAFSTRSEDRRLETRRPRTYGRDRVPSGVGEHTERRHGSQG
jgi:hypothetical protein